MQGSLFAAVSKVSDKRKHVSVIRTGSKNVDGILGVSLNLCDEYQLRHWQEQGEGSGHAHRCHDPHRLRGRHETCPKRGVFASSSAVTHWKLHRRLPISKNLDGEEVFVVTVYRWSGYLCIFDISFDAEGCIIKFTGAPTHMTNTTAVDTELQIQIRGWAAPFPQVLQADRRKDDSRPRPIRLPARRVQYR